MQIFFPNFYSMDDVAEFFCNKICCSSSTSIVVVAVLQIRRCCKYSSVLRRARLGGHARLPLCETELAVSVAGPAPTSPPATETSYRACIMAEAAKGMSTVRHGRLSRCRGLSWVRWTRFFPANTWAASTATAQVRPPCSLHHGQEGQRQQKYLLIGL